MASGGAEDHDPAAAESNLAIQRVSSSMSSRHVCTGYCDPSDIEGVIKSENVSVIPILRWERNLNQISIEGNVMSGVSDVVRSLPDVNWLKEHSMYKINTDNFAVLVEHPEWMLDAGACWANIPVLANGYRPTPKKIEWRRIHQGLQNRFVIQERSELYRRLVQWPYMENWYLDYEFPFYRPPPNAPWLVPIDQLEDKTGVPDVMIYVDSDPLVCTRKCNLQPYMSGRCQFLADRYDDFYDMFPGPKFNVDGRDVDFEKIRDRVIACLGMVLQCSFLD